MDNTAADLGPVSTRHHEDSQLEKQAKENVQVVTFPKSPRWASSFDACDMCDELISRWEVRPGSDMWIRQLNAYLDPRTDAKSGASALSEQDCKRM